MSTVTQAATPATAERPATSFWSLSKKISCAGVVVIVLFGITLGIIRAVNGGATGTLCARYDTITGKETIIPCQGTGISLDLYVKPLEGAAVGQKLLRNLATEWSSDAQQSNSAQAYMKLNSIKIYFRYMYTARTSPYEKLLDSGKNEFKLFAANGVNGMMESTTSTDPNYKPAG